MEQIFFREIERSPETVFMLRHTWLQGAPAWEDMLSVDAHQLQLGV